MARWQITFNYSPNSVVAKKHNLTWITDDFMGDPLGKFILQGDYKSVLALASFERWQWINVNGYNAITCERTFDKTSKPWANGKLRTIHYIVRAHFGSPAYTLCEITRIDE